MINPRESWVTVIVIAAIGFVNYVPLRLYSERGLIYTAILAHLIETGHAENTVFSGRMESALGTVDRSCICSFFSDTYKIDHLPKQQVVRLVETRGTVILSINYTSLGIPDRCLYPFHF